ncbi:hypothetical protein [Pseudalkalibacillus hwajinpoensis]|uniref:Uncharacterized protein n=1 Tax=Guptibacillus hwajinpoensis TaxID=208199 RepID=A0A4U1MP23_9BACL|nr:hypothetical protein [Pseudalkalibacillus hwajinpoensis]TKD72260.1 hypothetical protein FBF83_05580 [Pseudalkalibacillus hwajinpoensis]
MQQYTGFYITLALIFILVFFNKYLLSWVKGIIVTYYMVVSYLFITIKNNIDRKYKDVLPVPDAYWDKNTGWVDTISNFLFLPLIFIILFVYINWFIEARTKMAKTLIILSLIPSAILFILITFLFSFGYGYRP